MMRRSRSPLLARVMPSVLVAAAGVACANPGPHNAATDGFQARPRNCVVEMLGALPGPDYVEIARISLEGTANYGAGTYRNSRASANALREMVCELGGDAVKTEVDAQGVVVRAIVFRRAPQGAT